MRLITRRGFDYISKRNNKRDGYHGPTLNGIRAVTSDSLMYFDDKESFNEAKLRTRWPIDKENAYCLKMQRHDNGCLLLWNEYTEEAEFYYYEELQQ